MACWKSCVWNLSDREQQQQPTLSHSDIFNFYSRANPDLLHANNVFALLLQHSYFQGVACPSRACTPALSSALRDTCPCCHLSWERDRAPAWAVSRMCCWAVLKGLAMVCVSQVASLNSHQPESRWKTELEMIPLDRGTHDVQCWMWSWCFFLASRRWQWPWLWFYFPKVFPLRTKGLLHCQVADFVLVFLDHTSLLHSFQCQNHFRTLCIFSVPTNKRTFLSPLPVDLLGLLLSVGSPGHSKDDRLLQTTLRKRYIFFLLTK